MNSLLIIPMEQRLPPPITSGDLEYLGKTDEGLGVTFEDGTWTLSGSDKTLADISFMSVKAGRRTYVFRADNFNDFNYLFGSDENPVFDKDISHISFWNAGGYNGPGGGGGGGAGGAVPEPATVFLLGSGLLGLFGYRFKFWKSKKS